MKPKTRISFWKKLIILIGICATTGIGTVCTLKFFQPAPPQSESARTTSAEPQPKPDRANEPKGMNPVVDEPMINLPGNISLKSLPGDYNADDHLWRLTNKTHPFNNPRYVASDIAVVPVATMPGRGQDERSMRRVAFDDLSMMFAAAKQAGVNLQVGSGYRSYSTQASVFSRYVQQYGEAAADKFSSRPGHSEHQSGLAVDLIGADGKCWVETCFESTSAGKWLAAHAHEYGFILRYQKGKELITGYQYEPWHFRYVGKDLAAALAKSGLTLEEAWQYIKK